MVTTYLRQVPYYRAMPPINGVLYIFIPDTVPGYLQFEHNSMGKDVSFP